MKTNRDRKLPQSQQTILCRREFGGLLRRLRLERGLSCEELATKAGKLSRSTLATIERGQRQAGAQVSERLADALGLAGETRRDFLVAGLKTTVGELLPQATKGLNPDLFRPMWELLMHHGIRQADGNRVRLGGKLTSESSEPLKFAALRLAERADLLSRQIRQALKDANSPFPMDIEVETHNGTILLVQLLPASSKLLFPPSAKPKTAKA